MASPNIERAKQSADCVSGTPNIATEVVCQAHPALFSTSRKGGERVDINCSFKGVKDMMSVGIGIERSFRLELKLEKITGSDFHRCHSIYSRYS